MNTVLTESVMEATDLPRAVASSTYSGVRFVGGAAAPALAGVIAGALGYGAPYWIGCAGLLIAAGVLFVGRAHLVADRQPPRGGHARRGGRSHRRRRLSDATPGHRRGVTL